MSEENPKFFVYAPAAIKRGEFESYESALAWAKEHLAGKQDRIMITKGEKTGGIDNIAAYFVRSGLI